MNQKDVKELYKLEEKLQLTEAKLIGVTKELSDIKAKFSNDRKDIWEFINTLTKPLREGKDGIRN